MNSNITISGKIYRYRYKTAETYDMEILSDLKNIWNNIWYKADGERRRKSTGNIW